MMPTNRYLGPYHQPFPIPPPDGESFDDAHERVHTTNDQMPPRSTQFRVAANPKAQPRLKAPPAYPSQVSHYSPYTVGPRPYRMHNDAYSTSSSSSSSPPAPLHSATITPVAREHRPMGRHPQESAKPKRSRNAWPAEMTREIINVLLNEFLENPGFQTTIYRSREERDHRFINSGRSILEEYNKVQNVRRRYFIPLSYLLQWDQLRSASGHQRTRQRANLEKKLSKPLEWRRLKPIFYTVNAASAAAVAAADDGDMTDNEDEAERDTNGKPSFEIDIFVSELKRRDMRLWNRGVAAFEAWERMSRKFSIDYILNHA
ncbi:hypothetical protein IWW50_004806 [Coemansia erecta]|nr:hypothetical protein GGF43_003770 [Coemansia sp. RSA 2618]KAJ2821042.1 hypothetical protein IWW50_004806 [Coemansia erecta]